MKMRYRTADFHGSLTVIPRPGQLDRIHVALGRSVAVLLAGPRQCGKTTLARQLLPADAPAYFDLENPVDLRRLEEPMTALAPLTGLVVIDEVQRRPDLFPLLRVLADREGAPARFLILGSASGDLLRQTSESLAGRVERVELGGFTLAEAGADAADMLWQRGGLPRSFTADVETDSVAWRENFIQTLLERDFPQWGSSVPAAALRRFWTMLGHYHGRTWNAATFARSLNVAPGTARRYLDLLTDAYMVRQLTPQLANVGKRQVRAPKVFIRDSGLLHRLLGIDDENALLSHPVVGASWEGFVIEQLLAVLRPEGAGFWATHQGAEIDLVLELGGRRFGVEVKRADAPGMTRSIHMALADLDLDAVAILHPGSKPYAIHDRVQVVPVRALAAAGGATTLTEALWPVAGDH